MIPKLLVQPAYFAPIAQYAAILQANTTEFETQDNFVKQTYRTRCYIYSANGKLLLNVPVKSKKGQKTQTTNIELNYDEDWQKLHLKSLQSAYRTSPFYEYYEDDLRSIFETKHQFLWELHQKTHAFVMDALQEERAFSETTEYFKDYTEKVDIRNWIEAKKDLLINYPPYVQVFDDKHGFIPNLSILDLLFMEGPNASLYLENLNLQNVIT
ncbi:WbqC family protein [Wenyingzhuangia sp. IMCC45467]